jgi:hypothetical protein
VSLTEEAVVGLDSKGRSIEATLVEISPSRGLATVLTACKQRLADVISRSFGESGQRRLTLALRRRCRLENGRVTTIVAMRIVACRMNDGSLFIQLDGQLPGGPNVDGLGWDDNKRSRKIQGLA